MLNKIAAIALMDTFDIDSKTERALVMDSSEIHNLLYYLQWVEACWSSDPVLRGIIQRLQLKVSLLTREWKVDEHGNQGVSVLETVITQLKQPGFLPFCLSRHQKSRSTTGELVLQNLEKLKFIRPEMEQMYSFVFDRSKSLSPEGNKHVLCFFSSIHESLKQILRSNAGILVPVKPKILALEDELRFLKIFLYFISEICIEHRFSMDLFIFAQAVAVNAAYLLHFLRVEGPMYGAMETGVRIELLELVEKLNPFQQPAVREIYLRALEGTNPVLLDHTVIDYECTLRFLDSIVENLGKMINNADVEFTAKNQIEVLHEDLGSLRFYLMDLPLSDSNQKLDNLMFKVQDLTIHTGCFIYSPICKHDNKFLFLTPAEKIGPLLDKIESVRSESDHFIMPRSWQSNFPKTNELGYVDFIIKNLKDRLHVISRTIDPLANQLNTIYKELVELRNGFGRVDKPCYESEEVKALFARYRDVAYQTEYFADSFLCGVVPFWSQKMGLVNLEKDICEIETQLKIVLNGAIDHGTSKSFSFISAEAKSVSSHEVMRSEDNGRSIYDNGADQLVGFEDEVNEIKDQIMGGSEQLTILSIAGMPGLGKTTIANSVYKDAAVTMLFSSRAWCSVSQVYNKENLLLDILYQVWPEDKEDYRRKKEKSFDQKLYQSLKGKKYLVVMDDIWDIGAWDDLRPSFPNDENGSRIIFTTRNQGIAAQANGIPYALRLFSDEESWKLLLARIFKEENCPPELISVGKKIAKSCNGLPLTVVLTSGLLKITERSKDSWEQLANVLVSHGVDYPRELHLGVLDLSYRHLPDHLKSCFLYFVSFPEDAEIPVWKLVRRWIAEGFVQPKAGLNSSLEVEAENNLNTLIDRSLVMIAKRSYKGGTKACRIHDLLHDFCIYRAREERFLVKTKRSDSHSTLTDSEVHQQYRLCIVQSRTMTLPQVRAGHFESRIRSLFGMAGSLNKNPNLGGSTSRGKPLSRLFSSPSLSRFRYYNKLRGVDVFLKFRLLRVLDLGNLDIVAEGSFDTITQLVHLVYLSLKALIKQIPDEIENLKNLETFVLSGVWVVDYIALPKTIWNMIYLKHIQIKMFATALFPSEVIDSCNKLDGLTSLSSLVIRDGFELERMMKKVPNLKKLKFSLLNDFVSTNFKLNFLYQLEELSISSYSGQFTYPSSLKKLTLSYLFLPWDEISVIGELPNLEALKLVFVKLEDEWCMKEGEFEKLRLLTLENTDIKVLDASSEHLPCLEQLVLERCRYLKELPSIGESPSLRLIAVGHCNTSTVAWANGIQDEQNDLGNDQFKLYITGDHWDT